VFALYRAIFLSHLRGNFLLKIQQMGSHLYHKGRGKVVTAETTTTGYKKSLVTFIDIPGGYNKGKLSNL
jgi:hypothetical protein